MLKLFTVNKQGLNFKKLPLAGKTFGILASLLIFVVILYHAFIKAGIISELPNQLNVLQCDAKWFNSIRLFGYTYVPNTKSNLAFFPLFPYLWKWSLLGALGISVFNLIIFMVSFSWLLGREKYALSYLFIISSLPCFIFIFLPYSEACFFLFGTALIYGYGQNSRIWQVIGLLGCCLTRSVSTVFIPAVIITEFLAYLNGGINKKTFFINAVINTTTCLVSILVVVIIQGLQTNKWFYYIEVQQFWQRHWLIPSLPLTTVSPNKVLGIDAVAFIIGIIAIYCCFKWFWRLARKAYNNNEIALRHESTDKAVYFCALFLSAIVIIDTGFTYNINGRTNIQCLNRHLLCTPFAVYFLLWIKNNKAGRLDRYVITGILILGFFITGVSGYYHHIIYYILFCYSFFFLSSVKRFNAPAIALVLFNLFFVVIFYHDFLNGFWIG
jgi:hypothetical protein